MQVVLLERVEKLGQMGDVVNVKDGYARNFLLARGKALRATKDNLKVFEAQRAQLEARNLEERKEAEAVAEKMNGTALVVIRQSSESGHLYGSVAPRDVAEGLTAEGFTVSRNQVVLDKPIKELGMYDLRVALHPEVSATVSINVARSEEEAERQARGENIIARADEDDFDDEDFEDAADDELLDDDAEAAEGGEAEEEDVQA